MQVPPTQQALECLEQNDAFLHACMGLVVAIPHFDRLLATLAEPATGQLPEEPLLGELLDVALGVIALRLQLGVQLERLVAMTVTSDTTPVQPAKASVEELLR
jgi:hypothetical protein